MTHEMTDPSTNESTSGSTDAAADDRVAPGGAVVSAVRRAGWLVLGLACVGLGAVGIVVPGLPTTIFFIVAAGAFAKSSPRLEAWVLGLPKIGPMVADHRAGLGMPLRAKVIAISMIVVAVSLSAWFLDSWAIRGLVVALGAVGVAVVARQPTRR